MVSRGLAYDRSVMQIWPRRKNTIALGATTNRHQMIIQIEGFRWLKMVSLKGHVWVSPFRTKLSVIELKFTTVKYLLILLTPDWLWINYAPPGKLFDSGISFCNVLSRVCNIYCRCDYIQFQVGTKNSV